MDPDHGSNIAAKLSKLQQMGASVIHPNLRIVPRCPDLNDPEWTENLSQLPYFTFRTFFSHFANRVDEGAEDLGDCDTNTNEEMESQKSLSLDPSADKIKVIDFFRGAHVQKIRFHPLPSDSGLCYIHCTVIAFDEEGPAVRCESVCHGFK